MSFTNKVVCTNFQNAERPHLSHGMPRKLLYVLALEGRGNSPGEKKKKRRHLVDMLGIWDHHIGSVDVPRYAGPEK